MSKLGWRQLATGLAAAAVAVLGALPSVARAQGVTTGGIAGNVTDDAGAPVEAAQIQVVNRRTGFSTGAISRDNGRYVVLGLESGGPYTVIARRIGFKEFERNDLYVPLSQTLRVDIRFERAVATLSGVRVTADANAAIINGTRTGVVTTVSDSALRRLPTLNRNFTDFVALTPQVNVTDQNSGNGANAKISAVGVNNRYNGLQIDGATESDVFGLGATGQPGGAAQAKSIGIESVKEYQVLVTPYDVRQGNFAGALVNAVTKNGTNTFTGNAYYTTRNETFTRDQVYLPDFNQTQYGVTLGGPIVKDRVHFFVNPEFQTRVDPARGPFVGGSGSTAAYVDTLYINRFTRILEDTYGVAAGSAGSLDNDNPLANVFGRLDFQLPWNSRLVVRHNYGSAEKDVFERDITGSQPAFKLGSNAYNFQSVKNSTVAQLYTNWTNGANNELFLSYTTVNDKRLTPGNVPQIQATVPRIGGGTALLRAGTEESSHINTLDQTILELTDNFTYPLGAHRITVGTRNELYTVKNVFGQRAFGTYEFGNTCPASNVGCNLDSLAAGLATRYRVGAPFPNDPDRGAAAFDAATFGFYVQDQWQATDRLSFTGGLRLEIPVFRDEPIRTQSVQDVFGRNTSELPSGVRHWAPRFGFNWDATGDQRNQVRGGFGVFVGRPAYVWLANTFSNSGSSGYGQIDCRLIANDTIRNTPVLSTTTIATTPQNCGNPAVPSLADINLLDRELHFPTMARTSLGYDRRVGENWIVTVEGIYNNAMYNFFFDNIAKSPSTLRPVAPEFRGRTIYSSGFGTNSTPALVNPGGRTNVIDVRNQDRDYSYSLSTGVQRRFQNRFEGSAFYTFTQARDVQSYASSVATSNFRQGRSVSGALSDANLSRSRFEIPHRLVLSGTYAFPSKTDVSVIFTAQSGSPFDYSYGGQGGFGDLNGDGQNNDLLYIPRSAYDTTQIRFAGTGQAVIDQQVAFERFIERDDCLDEQRGTIMGRNTCRAPWSQLMNVSLRQSLQTLGTQNLSLQLDVFNFLNLLNSEWGRQPFLDTQGSSSLQVLTPTTATAAINSNNLTGRPVYQFNTGFKSVNFDNLESNYQLQMSVRYSF